MHGVVGEGWPGPSCVLLGVRIDRADAQGEPHLDPESSGVEVCEVGLVRLRKHTAPFLTRDEVDHSMLCQRFEEARLAVQTCGGGA
eukprot:10963147-Lingulodinium_polyedra.AAC.1